MARKNFFVLNADRPTLRPTAPPPGGGGGTPLPPLVYQEYEDDLAKPVRVRYGGANGFVGRDYTTDYYEGKGNYTQNANAWVETTIEAGYTRIRFEGIIRQFNAPFDVYVNGTYHHSGFQGPVNVWDDLAGLSAGDVVRYVNTTPTIFFVDQFTQLSS